MIIVLDTNTLISKNNKMITLNEGSGGKQMQKLIEKIRDKLKLKDNWKNINDDAATLKLKNINKNLVFTTDSYTVNPVFFPGGDIGKLALCGTINDLAVMGAKPSGISLALVIEEGFSEDDLMKIIFSIGEVSKKTGIPVVTGDTKVMNKGGIDKIVINTSGIGFAGNIISNSGLSAGDKIIVSGSIGDHGIALLSKRFDYETELVSDCAPVIKESRAVSKYVTAMKDPTRGGIAAVLNEMAEKSNVKIILDEKKIPVKREVAAVCELLGLSFYEIACEGRIVCGVKKEHAEDALKILKKFNNDSAIIGEVSKGTGVFVRTIVGMRPLEVPTGKLIPRIC